MPDSQYFIHKFNEFENRKKSKYFNFLQNIIEIFNK
jgi:hypothetical protein